MQRNTRRSEQLWARVHGALDAHRDPLEDARTVELLAQCPDEAQRVLRLLDLLQPAPIVRRSWPAPLLAAGLFLALALYCCNCHSDHHHHPEEEGEDPVHNCRAHSRREEEALDHYCP